MRSGCTNFNYFFSQNQVTEFSKL